MTKKIRIRHRRKRWAWRSWKRIPGWHRRRTWRRTRKRIPQRMKTHSVRRKRSGHDHDSWSSVWREDEENRPIFVFACLFFRHLNNWNSRKLGRFVRADQDLQSRLKAKDRREQAAQSNWRLREV